MLNVIHRSGAGRLGRTGALAVALTVLLGLAGGSPVAQAAAVGVPTTYDGPAYASTVNRPSENKPQSKLWHTDGSWWALMVTGSATTVRIHQLLPDHTWRDTGTVVDTRLNSSGDAVWDPADGKLFVASRGDSSNLQVARLSYDSAADRWSVDPGFPVVVNTGGGSESATIDRDSTGRLWVTYTQRSRLYVTHSDVTGTTWVPGFQPAVGDVTLASDDISALIAFGSSIGLLWSDQESGVFRFAVHDDAAGVANTWRVEDATAGAGLADDHLNLKQLSGDAQGRVFAAVKTSNDLAGPDAPLTGVLVRTPGAGGVGTWQFVVAGTVADDHTRPVIMIDQTNQELYFFATAPVAGGDIFYKKTSLANPQFGPGRGERFVDSSRLVNNATAAKHPVTAATGLVVLAVAEGAKHYVHAEMALAGGGGGGPVSDTTAPSVPQGLSATVVPGGVDLRWSASSDAVGVSGYTVVRDGVRLTDVPATSASDTTVQPGQTYSYTVEAYDAAGNRSGPSAAAQVMVPPTVGGQIAFRGASTKVGEGLTTLTIARPTSSPGDLLLATIDIRGARNVKTPPTGWVRLPDVLNGTALRKATFYRVAGSAEPTAYTWTFDGRPPTVGTVLAWSGVSATEPVESAAGQPNPRSTRLTAPSVTASPGGVVVGLFAVNVLAGITPEASLTERAEVSTPPGAAYPLTGEAADGLAAGGATGPRTATSSVAGLSVGQLVALRPAA